MKTTPFSASYLQINSLSGFGRIKIYSKFGKFLFLGVVTLLFYNNCSGYKGTGEEGSFSSLGGGSESPAVFEAKNSSVQVLPFRQRVSKLENLFSFLPSSAFNRLRANRFILGDHDHSQSINPSQTWSQSVMEKWIESIEPICQSSEIINRYAGDHQGFLEVVYGRKLSYGDQELLQEIAAGSGTQNEKLFILCSVSLSSLEFVSESSLAESPLVAYGNRLANMLVARNLSSTESDLLENGNIYDLRQLLETWTADPSFHISAKTMMEVQLATSGKTNEVDFNLPGQLMQFISREDRSFSEVLTADYCVDENLEPVSCDTASPYNAGVLTTKAFMVGHTGRFNLGRAGKLMEQFACKNYPMDQSLQPPIKRERIIDMFAQDQLDDGTDGAFGNGFACYTCHSQFGAHAQLFVKFDAFGNYVDGATGAQNPDLEAGKSFNDLFTSHLKDSNEAASEASQVFGRQVANLKEASEVIVQSDEFWNCSVQKSLQYFLNLDHSEAEHINVGLLRDIVRKAKTRNPQPSLSDLVVESLSHPLVMLSIEGRLQ